MAKGLVIVESPAKAKTITKYLGKDFTVLASYGHIKDLPEKELGVDVEHGFEPTYELIPDTKKRNVSKILRELKSAAQKADAIYLAADPDREGEAICQHLREELVDDKNPKPVYRLLFNEITKEAIQASLQSPQQINQALVEAQQARRVIDRLVGYEVSPMLNRGLGGGKVALSAGRVQSVALRLVVEREREILAFQPTEYWTFDARFAAALPPEFTAKLFTVHGATLKTGDFDKQRKNERHIRTEAEARDLERQLREVTEWRVATVTTKEKKRHPVAPFITSTLQQEASRKLAFPVKKTMLLAQKLYEGVELGPEGSVGLITYMRTDSTRIANSALMEVRDFIAAQYGAERLPAKPNQYQNKKGAQDAHEAIRPTSVWRTPEKVAPYLAADELALYRLIWQRFVASQMAPAIYDATTIDIEGGPGFVFRATGAVLRFDGFLAVYEEGKDEQDADEEALARKLPQVTAGERVECRELHANQSFTRPPARYTEATLVKTLEERGIGRPSTYAQTLSVIQSRNYVEKRDGRFHPTPLGMVIADILTENFTDLFDPGYTAALETQLDEIEEGRLNWRKALENFYEKFRADLQAAEINLKKAKDGVATDEHCHKCGAAMVLRLGRFGKYLACTNQECKATRDYGAPATAGNGTSAKFAGEITCENCGRPMVRKSGRWGDFLACTGYPECKTTRKLTKAGTPKPAAVQLDEACPICGQPLAVRQGRYGEFIGCSNYPKCTYIKREAIMPCPRPGCGGDITERRSGRGRVFYRCTNTACDVVYWDRPVSYPCPSCGAPFTLQKTNAQGETYHYCADKENCGWTELPAEKRRKKDTVLPSKNHSASEAA